MSFVINVDSKILSKRFVNIGIVNDELGLKSLLMQEMWANWKCLQWADYLAQSLVAALP